MTFDIYANFSKANKTAGKEAPSVNIKITKEFGEPATLIECADLQQEQAQRLCDVLLACLPGGTVDRLLAELMKRKSSLLTVPLK